MDTHRLVLRDGYSGRYKLLPGLVPVVSDRYEAEIQAWFPRNHRDRLTLNGWMVGASVRALQGQHKRAPAYEP
jgi:hypothetical protein